jgi:hypothetical protein
MPEVVSPAAPDVTAPLPLLDEELRRLPEKYRLPLVLCCLAGKTQQETADELLCSKDTVKRRLNRGRELLRLRLTRRGVALSAATSIPVVAEGAAPAVPPGWIPGAVEAARGTASSPVATLVEGILKDMKLLKLKMIVAAVLVIGATGALAGFVIQQNTFPSPRPSPEQPEPTSLTANTPLPNEEDPSLPKGAIGQFRFDTDARAIFFSPDGKRLAASHDGSLDQWKLSVYEVKPWTKLCTITVYQRPPPRKVPFGPAPVPELPVAAAFTRDGKQVFAWGGTARVLRLWNASNGAEVASFAVPDPNWRPGPTPSPLSLSPDGRLLAAGQNGILWQVATGARLPWKERLDGSGTAGTVFSPDSKLIAMGGWHKGAVMRLWDVSGDKEGTHLRDLAVAGDARIDAATFSPDSKTLTVGYSDGWVRNWDVTTGKQGTSYRIFNALPTVYFFTPDGKVLVKNEKQGSPTVVFLDTQTGKQVGKVETPRAVPPFFFTPDSRGLLLRAPRDQPFKGGQDLSHYIVWPVP